MAEPFDFDALHATLLECRERLTLLDEVACEARDYLAGKYAFPVRLRMALIRAGYGPPAP